MMRLKIDGEFTVSKAVTIGNLIIEALGHNDGLELSLNNITNIDITGFQILLATIRECDRHSMACVFWGPLSEACIERAVDAGFLDGSSTIGMDLVPLFRAYI